MAPSRTVSNSTSVTATCGPWRVPAGVVQNVLAGSTVTAAADRAGITKQAMGRLATELEDAGYIRVQGDPKDARARVLQLTKTGKRLMLDSLEVMAELERRYACSVGRDRLTGVLRGLAAFVEAAERD
jgi:DNA-binding MarR family transcriptional regulator